jgi:tetratricopeptide (TPR) repeat protein
MGDESNALKFRQTALQILETYTSQSNSDLATIYNNIAQIHLLMRNFEEARFYYEKTLEIDKTCSSSDHPHLALTYNDLGQVYIELEMKSKALFFAKRHLRSKKNIFLPIIQHSLPFTTISECVIKQQVIIQRRFRFMKRH